MALGWYSALNPVEKRTYWAYFAGLALDSMDHTIYALVIPALMATLGITAPEAGYLATAALWGTAIGGWGAGILADFAAAFAGGFWQLLGIRFLQGLGYGGEAAIGGVLISEVIRSALRGRV